MYNHYMNTKTLSPSVLAGLPLSQQKTVVDQGPGRTVFVGTKKECEEFLGTLAFDVRMWCKIL